MNKPPVIVDLQVDLWFECPGCADQVNGAASVIPLPFNDLDDTDDPSAAIDETYESRDDVECTGCGETYTVVVTNSIAGVKARIRGHEDVVVETSDPYYVTDEGGWHYPEEPPDDPYGIYRQAIADLKEVLDRNSIDGDGTSIIHRMVFTQHIAAFEAYLAETLVKAVTMNPAAMLRLLAWDRNLKERKFPLHALLSDPELPTREVRSYLRTIVYHRIEQVNALYKAALGIIVLSSQADSAALIQAIDWRHDCIHRNGYTVDQVRLQVFTVAYVEEIAGILEAIVHRIEAAATFGNIKIN